MASFQWQLLDEGPFHVELDDAGVRVGHHGPRDAVIGIGGLEGRVGNSIPGGPGSGAWGVRGQG